MLRRFVHAAAVSLLSGFLAASCLDAWGNAQAAGLGPSVTPGLSQTAGDARYCKLTGCTFTGASTLAGTTNALGAGSGGATTDSVINETTISGTGTTGDILRTLNPGGSLFGLNAQIGLVCVSAADTANGANSYAACFIVMTNGLGTTNAALNIIGTATTRGTNPVASVQLANDGAGGAVKVTLTTAGAGISGANVRASFFGLLK